MLGLGLEHMPDAPEAALHLGLREGPPGLSAAPRPDRELRGERDSPRTSQDTQASFQGPDSPAKAVSPARLAARCGEGAPGLLPPLITSAH